MGEHLLERVETENAYDRVYVLRHNGTAAYHFFWIQEPDMSKDVEVSNLRAGLHFVTMDHPIIYNPFNNLYYLVWTCGGKHPL